MNSKDIDAFHDYNCTVCLNDGNIHVYRKAVYYCPECDKYLCRSCNVCDHDVLGRRSVDKWGQPSRRARFDPCQKHPENAIQLYCKSHDVVCCPVCSQSDHRSCSNPVYIPQVPECNRTDNQAGLVKLRNGIGQLDDLTNTISKELITALANVNETAESLEREMKEFRARVEAMLDEMERKTKEDIAMLFEVYNTHLTVCDTIKTEMQELQKKLNAVVQNEQLLFSRIKQGQKKVNDKMYFLRNWACSASSKQVFEPHEEIEDVLKGLQGLGRVHARTCAKADIPNSEEPALLTGQIANLDLDHVQVHGQGLESQSVQSEKPYTLSNQTSVEVKTEGDKQCNIVDMCMMPSGSIVLTDYNNGSLKLLTSQNSVTNHCPLTEPFGVCHTEGDEVAVALGVNTIQFVSVGETLTKTHSFTTDHDCRSLAYSNKCLYITEKCGTAVYVYNLTGTRLRALTQSLYGEMIFSSVIRHITASRDGSRLYITGQNGLVTIDARGNLLGTYTSQNLVNGLDSACVNGGGDVFVGGYSSSSILQIRENTERKLAEISSSSGMKEIVKALCFDDVKSRLLVSCWNSDTVHVLHLLT